MAKWTEEEVQYLKDNYTDTDNEILAKKLNRNVGAINNKAFQFNLRKKVKTQLEIGARFGRLTILKEVKPFTTTTLSKGGKTYTNQQKAFLCVCDCGNEKKIRAQELLKGGTKSCGCLRKENGSEKIKKALVSEGFKKYNEKKLVESTKLDQLNKKKNKNNTSGHKGVTWNKQSQKWKAFIGFQGESIYLGLYADKQDAIKARKLAEEKYFEPVLEKYKDV